MSEHSTLTVIEASAGTGKTFTLVTRLLKLIFTGTEPERIVALTFSRAAAGEIFNSFIERLAHAARSPGAASAESVRVAGDPERLEQGDFAAMLRKVISRQHLSLIGTLDSFLMKIVRMLPLELGIEGELSILSDFRAPVERSRLLDEMMAFVHQDVAAFYREAFRLALDSDGSKSFLESFEKFVQEWLGAYRAMPQRAAWGEPDRIWPDGKPDGLDVSLGAVRAYAGLFNAYAGKKGVDTFVAALKGFSGSVKEAPKILSDEPLAAQAVKAMHRWCIASALRRTQGIYRLLSTYDAAYSAKMLQHGYVAFDDIPRLIGKLSEGIRVPLEYRLDAKFDHWALDEFQDTSRDQWQALSGLIDESRQSEGGRSVLVVGDRKQAIYDWRGGDVKILGELADAADGKEDLTESYRYLPRISDAINLLFGEQTIRGIFDMDDATPENQWKCPVHTSHNCAREGFVQVIQAEKSSQQAAKSDFFEPIANELRAIRPWERGLTCAILVRNRSFGEEILAYLKANGIGQVVFEGDSSLMDSPVLTVFSMLVKLAEHPGDKMAYAAIRHSPLVDALYPEGIPAPEVLSARLLADFTRRGVVRTFRDVREALKMVPDAWNAFTEERFADLMTCAAAFEDVRDETMRLSDFLLYLEKHTRRDFAEKGMVRIMTMHQSKGLGFDYVIVPFYEHDNLYGDRHLQPLTGARGEWIVENPSATTSASDPVLAAATRRARQSRLYASLCLNYVAVTRAKKALTLILHPCNAKAPAEPSRFSDLVRTVGLKTSGDKAWYLEPVADGGGKGSSESSGELESCAEVQSRFVRRKRESFSASRPSESFITGLSAARLFADDYGTGAEAGRMVHERYEAVEWMAQGDAADAVDRIFVRPQGAVELWRERAYELLVDGVWESGQFDRVAIIGEGDGRRAIVYDFKTNAIHDGESAEAYAVRLERIYRAQMLAYRRALAALVGIPSSRIEAKLVLTRTRSVVDVNP